MPTGTIKNIIRLSDSTDLPTAHLAPSQKSVGYGYIFGDDGRAAFFDFDAVEGARCEELAIGQRVEYTVESAAYLRATSVRPGSERVESATVTQSQEPMKSVPMFAPRLATFDEEVVDEASEESFPASDPPAFTPVLGVGRHG